MPNKAMRRYLVFLLVLSIVMALAAFAVMWVAPEMFIVAMPLLVLYFSVLTLIQHFLIVRGMSRSPKTFVQIFLGTTIGALFIHLIVIAAYVLSYFETWRPFLLAFAICFVVYLVFETVSLVRFVDNEKKKRLQNGD